MKRILCFLTALALFLLGACGTSDRENSQAQSSETFSSVEDSSSAFETNGMMNPLRIEIELTQTEFEEGEEVEIVACYGTLGGTPSFGNPKMD